ncbi:MAG: hypothetical protein QOG26_238 [Solirubrobacterales bacterium]|nr:hypothetical protein [Solirubrobacterales bacterium]
MTLAERLLAIHEALVEAQIPHSFGGAIALAYWTEDPRGTNDIDVNIFLPAAGCEAALKALPSGISQPRDTVDRIVRDGQIRLRWGDVPVDLFFSYEPVHEDAAQHSQSVPFAGVSIPVLGPVELAVFKARFDRTRDWADIEAMITARKLDVEAVRSALRRMLGDDDQRLDRLDEVEREALTKGPR